MSCHFVQLPSKEFKNILIIMLHMYKQAFGCLGTRDKLTQCFIQSFKLHKSNQINHLPFIYKWMVYLWKPPFDLPQYLLGSVAIKKHTKFISGDFVSKLIHTMIYQRSKSYHLRKTQNNKQDSSTRDQGKVLNYANYISSHYQLSLE